MRHAWPHSLTVRLDGVETARVEPPAEGHKRSDAPLEVPHASLTAGALYSLQVDAEEGPSGVAISDLVLCVAHTAPCAGGLAGLQAACLQRPRLCREEATELWDSLRSSEIQDPDAGLECASPWLQPLVCPLSCERLRLPARGRGCRHLRCFELEAYLATASRVAFPRRWRCPVCDRRLPPEDLVVCGFTGELLQQAPPDAAAVPLEPVLREKPRRNAAAGGSAPPGGGPEPPGVRRAVETREFLPPGDRPLLEPRRQRRRWRRGIVRWPPTAAGEPSEQVEAPAARCWGSRLRPRGGQAEARALAPTLSLD